MDTSLPITIKDLALFAMAVLCVLCLVKNRKLKQELLEETKKRVIPLLKMDIDFDAPGLVLVNDSDCAARNIIIDDCSFNIKTDFNKALIFKFKDIPSLKPHNRVKLEYEVFDGDHRVPDFQTEKMLAHLSSSLFETQITYFNAENIKFSSLLSKDKDQFIIKNVAPVKDERAKQLIKTLKA